MRLTIIVLLLAALAFSQSILFPEANDPWWESELGKHWTAFFEAYEICKEPADASLDSFQTCLAYEEYKDGDPYVGKVPLRQPAQILDNMACEGYIFYRGEVKRLDSVFPNVTQECRCSKHNAKGECEQ